MKIFCKTCIQDYLRLNKLLDSISKYNKDDIPVYVCIDKRYENEFYEYVNTSNINIVYTEDILKDYDPRKIRNKLDRWQIQQVVKFEFVQQSDSENHLIIDSDNLFIKSFFVKDFINDKGELYTIKSPLEDRVAEITSDVITSEIDYTESIKSMSVSRKQIQKIFERNGTLYEFGPPPVLWSKKVVEDFYENYLLKNKLTYVDIIKNVPLEYNWYGEWLLKSKCIPLNPIEPLFKNISNKSQYDSLLEKQITKDDLAKSYLGINIQTNWSAETGVLDYEL
tara:strand:+ start:203 stop:1042 length:840 start_codon:yes stop_codon:yes gene_type:complete